MEIVTLENISKTYSNGKISFEALKNINLKIEKGDFLVLAGPSGSGKTTALNIIGAMDKATSGKIIVSSKDITGLKIKEASEFRKKELGFIFQNYNLIPVLSAYENVELALDLMDKFSKKDKKDKINSILKDVGIFEQRNKRPGEMSGGQQQRVAIARALVKKPSIILADEPTANLDSHTGEAILDLMAKLNQELNISFIFSSHDQRIISRAKRVVHLSDGKIALKECF